MDVISARLVLTIPGHSGLMEIKNFSHDAFSRNHTRKKLPSDDESIINYNNSCSLIFKIFPSSTRPLLSAPQSVGTCHILHGYRRRVQNVFFRYICKIIY